MLNYLTHGTGKPLVFQHGLAANINQCKKLLGELEGIRLISTDCPGHGASMLPQNYSPSFNQYAEDVLQITSIEKIEKAYFGGLSMGAGIALNIATRFPEIVKGLILLRPAWLWSDEPSNLLPILEASSFIGKGNYIEDLLTLDSFKRIHDSVPLAAKSILGIFGDAQQGRLAEVIEHLVLDKPVDSLEKLERVSVPTLIIVNHDDPLHPVNIGEVLHEKMKHSFLVKVASRYIEPELHREQVRRHIADFVLKMNGYEESME